MPREIWTFLKLVAAKWASLVTGAFSALLVLLGLGISIVGAFGIKIPSDSIIQFATWALAAICGGYAAFSVWHREHVEKEKLQAKLTPKLKLSYEPHKAQCHSVSTFTDQFGRNPIDAMCFRLEINNTGEDTVLDCEAHLIEVYYDGETSELGPMNLTWAGSSPGITKVNVRKGIPAYLDVATIDANNNVKPCSLTWPNNRSDFFKRQGTYILKVVLTATNCVTCGPLSFRLNFDGNWRTSTLVAA